MSEKKKLKVVIVSESDILDLAKAVREYNEADLELDETTAEDGTEEHTEIWARRFANLEFLIMAARNCVGYLAEKDNCLVTYCGDLSNFDIDNRHSYVSQTTALKLRGEE